MDDPDRSMTEALFGVEIAMWELRESMKQTLRGRITLKIWDRYVRYKSKRRNHD